MADYYPLLAKAVAGLEKNTGEARRALYERARTALVTQLRSVEPALSESDITRERLALEEAIRKVEAEAARRARFESGAELRRESSDSKGSKQPEGSTPHAAKAGVPPTSQEAEGQAEERSAADMAVALRRASRRDEPETVASPGEGLKGLRDVVAEAESLGEATAQAGKTAREAYAAVPAPSPEFDRLEPRLEPEGLRSRERSSRPDLQGQRFSRDEVIGQSAKQAPREYAGAGAVQASAADEGLSPPSLRRPLAPRIFVEEEAERLKIQSYGRWLVIGLVAAALAGLSGLIYWQWPAISGVGQRFVSPLRPVTTSPAPQEAGPSRQQKIADRVTPAEPGTQRGKTTSVESPAVPVAQRVVLYEEDASDPAGKRYVGTTVWRTEMAPAGPGQPPDMVIRADIEIPERKLTAKILLRRNSDKTLPATHTVELMFSLPPDFAPGGIQNIPGILMKQAEQMRGIPLAGLAVKVTNGYFLIGLSSVEADAQRNIQLLKERTWFDVPIVYNNGKRAILAIEKGTPGERAFAAAFQAWGQ